MADNQLPGPVGWPVIGNMFDLQQEKAPLCSLNAMVRQYGPAFKYSLMAGERICVASQKYVNEVCDEKRFGKRGFTPSSARSKKEPLGLVFAPNDDPNWGLAHRVLLPAFGPLNIEAMFDEMHDIASQLVLSWARKGPDTKLDAANEFSKLSLDTIGLCGMGYRLNSFYSDEEPLYVQCMNTVLESLSNRGKTLPFIHRWTNGEVRVKEARATMGRINKELIQHRLKNPTDKPDFLNAMLHGVDPKTGGKMPMPLVASNMSTFLVAGHDTTAGFLAFAAYALIKHPEAYKKAREEIDRVVGDGAIRVKHLRELKYMNAVFRETLRLYPSVPSFQLEHKGEDPSFTLGDYVVDGSPTIVVLSESLHRDPEVYGDDAELFKPERMLDEQFNALPPNSWKPFGNGTRSCIGRSFAWQEGLLIFTMLLQRFDLELVDPEYEIDISYTITSKPENFQIRAKLREGSDATDIDRALHAGREAPLPRMSKKVGSNLNKAATASGQRLRILYGSNTGTCETLAQKLASDASMRGWATRVETLDASAGSLSKEDATVVIIPSYEGEPPDNAVKFVDWLQNLSGESELEGTKFAVFGCGHHDWVDTFHRVPSLVDEALARNGAERLAMMGLCDVQGSNVLDDFDDWKDHTLWPALASLHPDAVEGAEAPLAAPSLEIQVSSDKRAQSMRREVKAATVLHTKVLTRPGEPEKRHIELQLPDGVTYRAGDYAAVLPLNSAAAVRRVMARFGLPWDAAVRFSSGNNPTQLPSDTWVAAHDVLRAFVELSQVPSRKDLARFAAALPQSRRADFEATVDGLSAKKTTVSMIDLLERYAEIDIPFADFLSMLPPLRVRMYSISSSPLADPSLCTLTYSVIDQPGPDGWADAQHKGVATNYLADLSADDMVQIAIRPSHAGFSLPKPVAVIKSAAEVKAPASGTIAAKLAASGIPSEPAAVLLPAKAAGGTPVVMICSGSGVAPFRAFVQERAAQIKAAGGSAEAAGLGPAMLFVGCRTAAGDRIYSDELAAWERSGAVKVRYAHSREAATAEGCKYVQDRVRHDGDEVRALWDRGAKVYICGASGLVLGVRTALKDILFADSEQAGGDGYAKAVRAERIVADVFG